MMIRFQRFVKEVAPGLEQMTCDVAVRGGRFLVCGRLVSLYNLCISHVQHPEYMQTVGGA